MQSTSPDTIQRGSHVAFYSRCNMHAYPGGSWPCVFIRIVSKIQNEARKYDWCDPVILSLRRYLEYNLEREEIFTLLRARRLVSRVDWPTVMLEIRRVARGYIAYRMISKTNDIQGHNQGIESEQGPVIFPQ